MPRIPGIFSKEQVEGWKKVTAAVHKGGAKIFNQLMHTGRIGHPFNLPEGARIIAPSAVSAAGQIWTDQAQLQDYPVPSEMTAEEIASTKEEYVQAAKNAIEAGFDGVELHGANGYLLEQFLSPVSNIRTDNYGGSVENRSRFVLVVVKAVADAIGRERTGIRLSPYGVSSDMPHYPEIDSTYRYLSEQLDKIDIAHIHLVDHSSMGAPQVPTGIKIAVRNRFRNTLIISGGYDLKRAEEDLKDDLGDLVAFGRPFISNPDLVNRFRNNHALSGKLDHTTFYTQGQRGYTDYPVFSA